MPPRTSRAAAAAAALATNRPPPHPHIQRYHLHHYRHRPPPPAHRRCCCRVGFTPAGPLPSPSFPALPALRRDPRARATPDPRDGSYIQIEPAKDCQRTLQLVNNAMFNLSTTTTTRTTSSTTSSSTTTSSTQTFTTDKEATTTIDTCEGCVSKQRSVVAMPWPEEFRSPLGSGAGLTSDLSADELETARATMRGLFLEYLTRQVGVPKDSDPFVQEAEGRGDTEFSRDAVEDGAAKYLVVLSNGRADGQLPSSAAERKKEVSRNAVRNAVKDLNEDIDKGGLAGKYQLCFPGCYDITEQVTLVERTVTYEKVAKPSSAQQMASQLAIVCLGLGAALLHAA